MPVAKPPFPKMSALATALPVIFPEMIPRTPFCVTRARVSAAAELSARALLVGFFLEGLLVGLELFFLFLGLVFLLFLLIFKSGVDFALDKLGDPFFGIFSKKSGGNLHHFDGAHPEAHAESEYHRNNNQISELGVLLDVKNIAALV